MSTPLFEEKTTQRDSTPSSYTFTNYKESEPYLQEEKKESNETPSPIASSNEENRKHMEHLRKKIQFFENVRTTLIVLIIVIGCASTGLLLLPAKFFGIPLYSILLASHSLAFSCLFIANYKFLLPLIDESFILSSKIEDETYTLTAYRSSENEKFWCFWKILLCFLVNAGIWIYLSHTDQKEIRSIPVENDKLKLNCILSGVLVIVVSFYALVQMGTLYSETDTGKRKTKQRKGEPGKKANPRLSDFLNHLKEEHDKKLMELLEQEQKNEMKLTEILEKAQRHENTLMELLKEKEKENEILSRENRGLNSKIQGLSTDNQNLEEYQ